MTSRATPTSRRLWLREWLRVVELVVEPLGLLRGAVLEDADGANIGQGLGRRNVVFLHVPRLEGETP